MQQLAVFVMEWPDVFMIKTYNQLVSDWQGQF